MRNFFYTKRFTFDFSGKQKMNPKILLYKNDFMRSSIKLGFLFRVKIFSYPAKIVDKIRCVCVEGGVQCIKD